MFWQLDLLRRVVGVIIGGLKIRMVIFIKIILEVCEQLVLLRIKRVGLL
jgi:uncharacterized membrane-anchored protein YhcB (DUF1043 family)